MAGNTKSCSAISAQQGLLALKTLKQNRSSHPLKTCDSELLIRKKINQDRQKWFYNLLKTEIIDDETHQKNMKCWEGVYLIKLM